MKTHAIIPIFIPHEGCPNDCVFCNQRRITARQSAPSENQVRQTIEQWLTTLDKVQNVNIAFYGGSFTAIPIDDQQAYLSIANEYVCKGLIDGIHLSTRPDYIDDQILNFLSKFNVTLIELGAQSFSDDVLMLSKRGHTAADVIHASKLIKSCGLKLGIQLMVGLPGDDIAKDIYSAEQAVALKPDVARLYPTIVIEDTELYDLSLSGSYKPLEEADAVIRTAEMYKIIEKAGIDIIRVGLKSTDLIKTYDNATGSSFHPAFRQLVESHIAKEIIENQLLDLLSDDITITNSEPPLIQVVAMSSPRDYSNMLGQHGSNRKYFTNKYKNVRFSFATDSALSRNHYKVLKKQF